jgi:hypothetical protein
MSARTLVAVSLLTLISALVLSGCDKAEQSLTRALEEEKSYTRHAMEYHREHPDKRRGDTVLDTWSAADYIAVDVVKQDLPGEWAKDSDQLPFLPPTLKADSNGHPFCVIQRADAIIVIRALDKKTSDCTIDSAKRVDVSKIRSGDMEFSGRTDYWTYRLDL